MLLPDGGSTGPLEIFPLGFSLDRLSHKKTSFNLMNLNTFLGGGGVILSCEYLLDPLGVVSSILRVDICVLVFHLIHLWSASVTLSFY